MTNQQSLTPRLLRMIPRQCRPNIHTAHPSALYDPVRISYRHRVTEVSVSGAVSVFFSFQSYRRREESLWSIEDCVDALILNLTQI